VGSVLCGSAELIQRRAPLAQGAGGGMRQVGVLAAAGLHALDHHVTRWPRTMPWPSGWRTAGPDRWPHAAQRRDQHRLRRCGRRPGPVLLEHLAARGILATGLLGLCFVTHLDVDAAGIDHTLVAVREFFALPVGAHARAATATAPY
jgi:threonine aldolase